MGGRAVPGGRADDPGTPSSPAHDALVHELRRAVAGEVRFTPGDRALYANDASVYRQVPLGVVVPRDADDVLAALEVSRRHGAPIVARGCGTGLAGQSVNTAVMLDFSKYLNRIVDLDPDRRTARVQPGVICDQLRDAAAVHGLTFAPDPATHDRCTFGGMIGNNSCGAHSLMGGKTVDNVHALDVVTYDGTRMRVGPTAQGEYEAILRAGGRPAEIYRGLDGLRDRYAPLIRSRYPAIPRRVSGYNLDDLLPEKGFDLAKALVGTESTCVLVLEATVRLLPRPHRQTLLVAGYPDAAAAADAVPELLTTEPIALECFDAGVLANLDAHGVHLPGAKELPSGGAWLLAEYGGDTQREADARAGAARRWATGAREVAVESDPRRQRDIWDVRRSTIEYTRVPGRHSGLAGWEDAAVAPERLGDYLRDYCALVARHGYHTVLFGHFGQGCVHNRLDLDLATAEGIDTFRRFIDEAGDLVVSYGGSLSGEHGDGQLRASQLGKMFGPELVQGFREFKRIFDPGGRMNPGKVVDAYRPDQHLRLGTDYHPPRLTTHFAFPEDEKGFADAANRCFGIGKCRRLSGGTMCPSFMVTREEKHTTRGRARLLFEMTRGERDGELWRDEAVKEALDLCLSCKGCKSDCPVGVDMATYKAEFLSHYYAGRLRPRSAYALGLIPLWARLGSRLPRVVNTVTRAPLTGRLVKHAAGVHPRRRVPALAPITFRQWFEERGEQPRYGRPPVLLWPDTFTNHFAPDVGIAAVEVLEDAGFTVRLPRRPLCCGRPLYDYGMVTTARRWLRRILRELRAPIRAGAPLVGLEPSCLAVFRDELPNLLPDDLDARRLCQQSVTLGELLDRHGYRPPPLHRSALVQAHCHHQAVLDFGPDQRLLDAMELASERPDSGCCGMAGGFGFEYGERYEVSVRAGERVLLPRVRETARDTLIIADGFSCREQISQGTGRDPLHLAQVLRLALHHHRQGGTPDGR
ncbi:FAD-binding and (Fe-S)-binding domain-containing protein [Streptomyces sp. NPDC052396]|uniref:FAD-binding and (Fe-S)-binding domain-containing protein n=1 Tax=Streptomyces sp. NPDC052396 TaxID=3365689 RepID=UPI0037CEC5DB